MCIKMGSNSETIFATDIYCPGNFFRINLANVTFSLKWRWVDIFNRRASICSIFSIITDNYTDVGTLNTLFPI